MILQGDTWQQVEASSIYTCCNKTTMVSSSVYIYMVLTYTNAYMLIACMNDICTYIYIYTHTYQDQEWQTCDEKMASMTKAHSRHTNNNIKGQLSENGFIGLFQRHGHNGNPSKQCMYISCIVEMEGLGMSCVLLTCSFFI